jgi:hypothetical protein
VLVLLVENQTASDALVKAIRELPSQPVAVAYRGKGRERKVAALISAAQWRQLPSWARRGVIVEERCGIGKE